MQEAVPPGVGAMAAIMGVESAEALESLCQDVAKETNGVVTCANFNAPGQIVVAGNAASVARLNERVGELKGKAIPLKVSAPFHCSLMAPAAKVVAAELEKVAIKPLGFPVVANVDAKPNRDPSRVKELLVRQVDGAVRWEQAIRLMGAEGVTHAIEIGPGKVLAGLGKRIARDLKMVSVGDPAAVHSLAAFIGLN
jgi:[acyl-carrier-protein] S-malonyltransferase